MLKLTRFATDSFLIVAAVFPFWVLARLMSTQILKLSESSEPFSFFLAVTVFAIFSGRVLTSDGKRIAHAAGSTASFVVWFGSLTIGLSFTPLQLLVCVVGLYAVFAVGVIAIYAIEGWRL